MLAQKQGEEAIVSTFNDTENDGAAGKDAAEEQPIFSVKNALWHGGSAWDACWTAYLISVLYIEYRSRKEKEGVSFKNHVIQWFEVLDGLLGPYWKAVGLAFNCTFLLFGSVIQLIACASNIYYINDHLDKRTWTYIFGACCATTVFIPSFHNYRIWSFLGLGMTTYTAWYLTVAALVHGQAEDVQHTGPKKLVLYFTGATNILYTFGGHAVTV
ncbi:Transmembrane amino acid transporter family protein [Perilla frutescens var. hirtella]|uniref:Transmembrane amino acid transporter family protein n=1 Tax=Perilla frutescens var. hirtella TaxID=608512 RepID=A0AAD4J0V8_PERFH|nr:Transmembrane amino acid transporter family protein [Perilla frutescens var. hirtella]KAH6824781.1 Transmembrane amino acid transporter family protein [Perilla frutescens var. hirtella]